MILHKELVTKELFSLRYPSKGLKTMGEALRALTSSIDEHRLKTSSERIEVYYTGQATVGFGEHAFLLGVRIDAIDPHREEMIVRPNNTSRFGLLIPCIPHLEVPHTFVILARKPKPQS